MVQSQKRGWKVATEAWGLRSPLEGNGGCQIREVILGLDAN